MKQNILITFICMLCLSFTISGQNSSKKIMITGSVLDSNKKPVSGAMIFIDNERTDKTTNKKGSYKIKVGREANTIAVFKPENGLDKAEIAGRTIINFTLKVATPGSTSAVQNDLYEETVNIGYGTVKKKDLTTQVGKLDATKRKYGVYQNIYDLIRGEIPGVQVSGKNIIIQGPSSINSSLGPLLVVDGVIVNSLDDISPIEVESVSVLKGASASIYGSRGANGVILVNLVGSRGNK